MSDHKIRPAFNPEGILCQECDLRIVWQHRDHNRKPWEGRWVHVEPDPVALAASMARHPSGKGRPA